MIPPPPDLESYKIPLTEENMRLSGHIDVIYKSDRPVDEKLEAMHEIAKQILWLCNTADLITLMLQRERENKCLTSKN